MTIIKITKSVVENLPFKDKGQMFYWDSNLKGFGVRVGAKTKSYIVQRDINGKSVTVTLGSNTFMSAEIARKEAKEKLLDMSKGINPNVHKQKQKDLLSLIQVHRTYIKSKEALLKPRSLVNYKGHINNHFKDWQNKPLQDISPEMVMARFQKLSKEAGTYAANNALRYLSALFNYMMAEDTSLHNPVLILTKRNLWNSKKRRKTIIKDEDLKLWYNSVNHLLNDSFRDALIFLLFTGVRKNEAFQLKWEDINFQNKTMLFPNTKNNKPLTLPMTDIIYDLLSNRKKERRSDVWVFDGKSKAGHITDAKKSINFVCDEFNNKKTNHLPFSFTLHDLRRTFITMAEKIEVSEYKIRLLVNHKTDSNVTYGYVSFETEDLRKASQDITNEFKKFMEIL